MTRHEYELSVMILARRVRALYRVNQRDFSRLLSTSQSYVSKWENGSQAPGGYFVHRILVLARTWADQNGGEDVPVVSAADPRLWYCPQCGQSSIYDPPLDPCPCGGPSSGEPWVRSGPVTRKWPTKDAETQQPPSTLGELFLLMQAHDPYTLDASGQWRTDLPTFGGPDPVDTSGVWSWSKSHAIEGTCSADLELVDRHWVKGHKNEILRRDFPFSGPKDLFSGPKDLD